MERGLQYRMRNVKGQAIGMHTIVSVWERACKNGVICVMEASGAHITKDYLTNGIYPVSSLQRVMPYIHPWK